MKHGVAPTQAMARWPAGALAFAVMVKMPVKELELFAVSVMAVTTCDAPAW